MYYLFPDVSEEKDEVGIMSVEHKLGQVSSNLVDLRNNLVNMVATVNNRLDMSEYQRGELQSKILKLQEKIELFEEACVVEN